jgi:tRNA threonylcarbamoyladenosine biosynthesis protein TsaB
MRVLAFDTATSATVVALRDGATGFELELRDDPPVGGRPGHAQKLLRLVEDALGQAGGWSVVDRIAVGIGPGTFTGLRIGISTAHALARGAGLPLVGVSTLASLEHAALASLADQRSVLAVIDARRGEAFVAGAGLSPRVLTPAALGDVAGQRASDGVIAVGDGAIKFRELLESAGAHVPEDGATVHRVSAVEHCVLAESLDATRPEDVQPEYLRLPDAEISLKP